MTCKNTSLCFFKKILFHEKKVSIDPSREATPTPYKNFKNISSQLVNTCLYRDNKLVYRTIFAFNFALVQITDYELDAYEEFLNKNE